MVDKNEKDKVPVEKSIQEKNIEQTPDVLDSQKETRPEAKIKLVFIQPTMPTAQVSKLVRWEPGNVEGSKLVKISEYRLGEDFKVAKVTRVADLVGWCASTKKAS